MRIILMVLALFLGGAGAAGAQDAPSYDFRQVKWGDTVDEVKAAEYWQKLLAEDSADGRMTYRIEEDDGEPVEVTYYFNKGLLFGLSFEAVGNYDELARETGLRYKQKKASLPDGYKEHLGVQAVQTWQDGRSQIECRHLNNGKTMFFLTDLKMVLPVIDNN